MQLAQIRMPDGSKPPGLVRLELPAASAHLSKLLATPPSACLQLKTGVNIVKEEGVLALYSGWSPAIARGLFYGGATVVPGTPDTPTHAAAGHWAHQLRLTSSGRPSVANTTCPAVARLTRLESHSRLCESAAPRPSQVQACPAKAASHWELQVPCCSSGSCPAHLLGCSCALRDATHSFKPGLLQAAVPAQPLTAAYHHLSAGVRLGCYTPLKEALGATKENPSLLRNIAAGSVSGGIASAVTNPIDLIKTRMQSKGNDFKTPGDVVRHVVAKDGVIGLWKGTVPSAVRLGC